MGKSGLADQWATHLEREGILVAWINGCESRGLDQASLLQRIKKQLLDKGLPSLPMRPFIEELNKYAARKPIVLIFEDHPELTLLDPWLRDLIRSLTGQVVVLITSPYPLSDTRWEQSIGRFTQISLRELGRDEISQFCRANGIPDHLVGEIGRQSQEISQPSLSGPTQMVRIENFGRTEINMRTAKTADFVGFIGISFFYHRDTEDAEQNEFSVISVPLW